MTNKAIPSLSTVGWTKNYNEIISKLYIYFVISEYSQSNSYYGKISSLKYILQNHSGVEEIKLAIQRSLTNMYIRYFKNVDVIVDVTELDNIIIYALNIIAIADDGITYKLDRNIETDSKNTIRNLDTNIAELYEI